MVTILPAAGWASVRAATLPLTWRVHLDELAASRRLLSSGHVVKLALPLREVSEAYNSGNFSFCWTPERLAARLHFFLPRDQAKVVAALRDVATPPQWLGEGRPLVLVDVGAGIGASALGAVRALRAAGVTRSLSVLLIDSDAVALSVAKDVLARCDGVRVEVATTMPDEADLIVFAAVLLEVAAGVAEDAGDGRCVGRLQDAVARLAPGGRVVVVEPALRDPTRRLMRVRDRLVAGGVAVLAPCTHAGRCAMLDVKKDWCHDDLSIDLPAWVQPLARAAGLRWQGLTFARLVLARQVELAPSFRVVAPPRDSRGRKERQLCGAFPDGTTLRWVDRLEKHASEGNSAFAELERGDAVEMVPAEGRVGAATVVKRG